MTCHAGGGWLLRVCTGLLSPHLSQPRLLKDVARPSKTRRLQDDSSSDTDARVARHRAAESRPKPSTAPAAPWSLPRPLPPPPSKASGAPSSKASAKPPAVNPKLPYVRGKQKLRHNTGKYAHPGGKNKEMFNAKYRGFKNYELDWHMQPKQPPSGAGGSRG